MPVPTYSSADEFEFWPRLGAVVSGCLLVLCGGGIVAYQAALWLHFGEWTPFDVGWVWKALAPVPSPSAADITWLGIRKAILWLSECSLSGTLVTFGVLMLVLALTNVGKYLALVCFVVYLVAIFGT
jgi:hypothetical protein